MQLQRRTTTDTGTSYPKVPTTRQSEGDDAKGDTQNPQAGHDLLFYTNMGAKALAKYLKTTKVVENLVSTTNQRTQQTPLDGAHSTSPRMNITNAPAGRQGTRRRRRMEESEKVAADIDHGRTPGGEPRHTTRTTKTDTECKTNDDVP